MAPPPDLTRFREASAAYQKMLGQLLDELPPGPNRDFLHGLMKQLTQHVAIVNTQFEPLMAGLNDRKAAALAQLTALKQRAAQTRAAQEAKHAEPPAPPAPAGGGPVDPALADRLRDELLRAFVTGAPARPTTAGPRGDEVSDWLFRPG